MSATMVGRKVEKNIYLCDVDGCGKICSSNHGKFQRQMEKVDAEGKVILDKNGNPTTVKLNGRGLGNWECPVHGKGVKVKRRKKGENEGDSR